MQVHMDGAQRASSRRSIRTRFTLFLMFAMVVTLGGLAAHPTATQAASRMKVVIVVGPVEGSTAKYISHAKGYAALARSYGASVTEVYSPWATWTQVQRAAVHANIFIYLGHGNGHPSPYGAFSSLRKNGMGLNSSGGHGNSNVKYWGQTYMRQGLHLAPNSVVLLNHLCYSAGNSEPGRADPTKSVAMQRADGYGTGFLRTGAKALFANPNGSLSSIISDLFLSNKNVAQIFQDDPSFDGARDFKFTSKHTPGSTVWMDPKDPGKYYHAVSGRLTLTAAQVRAG